MSGSPYPIRLELEDGSFETLPDGFTVPLGFPVPEGGGSRAPDSRVVVRSGDRIPLTDTLTGTGKLHATDVTGLLDTFARFCDWVARTVKVWVGDYAYLSVDGGAVPQPTMGAGWLSCAVTPVFYVAYLGWRRPDGSLVFEAVPR